MLRGEKRLAYFFRAHEAEVFGADFVKEPHWDLGSLRVLVYRSDDVHLAYCFKQTYRMHRAGLISARTAHARCGLLLGYSKADIRLFLRRRDRLI